VTRALLILALLAGCSGTPAHTDGDAGTVLRFKSPARDAELWVDGVYVEQGVANGVRLKPGPHQIEIRHDRYHTWYGDIRLAPGEQRTLVVDLAEILP
jgi:hypothetical protein